MAHRPLGNLMQQLHRLLGGSSLEPSADAELLNRFAKRRDQEAFAELMRRHGPVVWDVCRHVLGNVHDADDAFQATFFVLARQAAAIRKQASIGSWLHGVALRVSKKLLVRRARKNAIEIQAKIMRPLESSEQVAAEIRPLIHEELARLPEKFRAPLVLCYLEGKSNEQAARELGRPMGSMSRHLERGREILRERLIGRGVGVGTVLVSVLDASASVVPPTALLQTTLSNAIFFVTEPSKALGATQAGILAQGVLKSMFMQKLKMTVTLTFSFCLLAAGTGIYGAQVLSAAGKGESATAPTLVANVDPIPPNRPLPKEKDRIQPLSPLAQSHLEMLKDFKALFVSGGETDGVEWQRCPCRRYGCTQQIEKFYFKKSITLQGAMPKNYVYSHGMNGFMHYVEEPTKPAKDGFYVVAGNEAFLLIMPSNKEAVAELAVHLKNKRDK